MTLVHRACGVRPKHSQTVAQSKRKCCHNLDLLQLQGEQKACQQCIGEYYLDLKTFSSSKDPALRSPFSRRCEERGRASYKQRPMKRTVDSWRSVPQKLINFHFHREVETGMGKERNVGKKAWATEGFNFVVKSKTKRRHCVKPFSYDTFKHLTGKRTSQY